MTKSNYDDTNQPVKGLSQTDLLQGNHRSVFETATCMLLMLCMQSGVDPGGGHRGQMTPPSG